MATEIWLSEDAASQAQSLVGKLVAHGVAVDALKDDSASKDRDVSQLAYDVGVGLLVEATVMAVRAVVDSWCASRGLSPDQVEIRNHDEPSAPPPDDSEEQE